MIRIALVGDIGSGKTFFSKLFRYPVFNADNEVSKLYKKEKQMNQKIVLVEGMTCNHCKNNVEKNISQLEGVTSVEVNLEQKTVSIEGTVSFGKIREQVNKLGYEYKGER